jgi:hypothetical protein
MLRIINILKRLHTFYQKSRVIQSFISFLFVVINNKLIRLIYYTLKYSILIVGTIVTWLAAFITDPLGSIEAVINLILSSYNKIIEYIQNIFKNIGEKLNKIKPKLDDEKEDPIIYLPLNSDSSANIIENKDNNWNDKWIKAAIIGIIGGVILFIIIQSTTPDPDGAESFYRGIYRIFGGRAINNWWNNFKSSASDIHSEYKDVKGKNKLIDNNPINISDNRNSNIQYPSSSNDSNSTFRTDITPFDLSEGASCSQNNKTGNILDIRSKSNNNLPSDFEIDTSNLGDLTPKAKSIDINEIKTLIDNPKFEDISWNYFRNILKNKGYKETDFKTSDPIIQQKLEEEIKNFFDNVD